MKWFKIIKEVPVDRSLRNFSMAGSRLFLPQLSGGCSWVHLLVSQHGSLARMIQLACWTCSFLPFPALWGAEHVEDDLSTRIDFRNFQFKRESGWQVHPAAAGIDLGRLWHLRSSRGPHNRHRGRQKALRKKTEPRAPPRPTAVYVVAFCLTCVATHV